MKVAHIVKSSHNIGEGALINGMHNILRVDINKKLEFDLIDRKYFQAVHGEEYNAFCRIRSLQQREHIFAENYNIKNGRARRGGHRV